MRYEQFKVPALISALAAVLVMFLSSLVTGAEASADTAPLAAALSKPSPTSTAIVQSRPREAILSPIPSPAPTVTPSPTPTPTPTPTLVPSPGPAPASVVWARQFGTANSDYAMGVAVDGAGNVYVVGRTYGLAMPTPTPPLPPEPVASPSPSPSPGAVPGPLGSLDGFLRKYSNSGNLLWSRVFGTVTDDYVQGMVVDGTGNIYIAGYTYGTFAGQTAVGGQDVFLIKHDATGNALWWRQFGSDAADYANAIAVDVAGNVLVAGYSLGVLPGSTSYSGYHDAFVRKYDASGNDIWTRQFGTTGADWGTGVATDKSGNIYVAGYTSGTFAGQTRVGSYDAFVSKFDASGAEVWTRQFGTVTDDQGQAVAVDGLGNVFVAGNTGSSYAYGRDMFLRKYDGAGHELWTREFGTSSEDTVLAMTVDSAGNPYIAGYTGGVIPGSSSYLGSNDAFIRKYDSHGNAWWTNQFGTVNSDTGRALALDSAGSIYLVGDTQGTLSGQAFGGVTDAYIMKVWEGTGLPAPTPGPSPTPSPTPTPTFSVTPPPTSIPTPRFTPTPMPTQVLSVIWMRQAGSTISDTAYGVAVDASGNAYVTGITYGTLPGQTYLGSPDAFVMKFSEVPGPSPVPTPTVSPTPVPTPTPAFTPPASPTASPSPGPTQTITPTLTPTPTPSPTPTPPPYLHWARQFGSAGEDYARAIAVDGSGNSYVVGDLYGVLPGQVSSGSRDAFVRKYDAAGNELWTRQFGTTGNNYATGVAVDLSGNLYVVGHTYGAFAGQVSSGGVDGFLRKFTSLGETVWTRQFGTPGNDYARAVATDSQGNVYVAGDLSGVWPGQTSAGGADVFIRKYDASGTEIWTRQLGSDYDDKATGMAVDSSGNILVAGSVYGPFSGFVRAWEYDAFVLKCDSSGNLSWLRRFGTTDYDYATGVVVDSSGNSYVVGYTQGTFAGQRKVGYYDVFIRKFNASGNELWIQQFGTPSEDNSYGIAMDASANIYITGYTAGLLPGQTSSGYGDAYIIKVREVPGGMPLPGQAPTPVPTPSPVPTATLPPPWYALRAEIALEAGLDASGYGVVHVKITRIKKVATGETYVIDDGIGAYDANLTYAAAGVVVMAVAATQAFPSSGSVNLNVEGGTKTLFNAFTGTITHHVPPVAVADARLRLRGNKSTAYAVTLNFVTIATSFLGDSIQQDAPASMSFRRGDADASGSVQITDALLIAQYLAGIRPLNTINPVNSASVQADDSNGDKITISDALYIAQMLAGLRDASYNFTP